MSEHLTKETFLEKIFNYQDEKEWNYQGDLPSVIDFYADWCGPCTMQAPVLEKWAGANADKAVVGKLDVDSAPGVASRFGVMSIPTIIVFKGGEEKGRAVGLQNEKSLDGLLEKANA